MVPSYKYFAAFESSVSCILRLQIWNDLTACNGIREFTRDLLFPEFVFSELIVINGDTAVNVVLYFRNGI